MALSPTLLVAALSFAFPSLPGLIATQVITGLSHVTLVIAAQATIAGLDEGGRMETWFGWYTTCLSIGQLIGPLLGGLLLSYSDVRITFAVVTALPLAAIAISWHLRTSVVDPRPPHLPRQGPGYLEQLALLRTNAGVQMSLLVTTGTLFAVGAHTAILPLFLEAKGVPATGIGVLVSLRALFSTVVRPVTSPIVRVFRGRARTLLVAIVVIAMATGTIGITTSYVLIAVLTALVGIGVGITQPLSMVAVADYVPATSRGPALGMRLMGNRAAQVTSPLLLGVIAEVSTFATAFLSTGAILLVAALAVARLAPRFERFKTTDPPRLH